MEEKIYDNCDVLIIDEKDRPALTVSEAEKFKPIIKDFMETYTAHPDEDVQTWLTPKLASYLPEKSEKEINQISTDIVKSINIAEEKKSALVKAKSEGVSSKGWFAKECQKAVSGMASAEAANYMQTLDNAVTQANESMIRTVTTQSGMISQSPVLDGYIAEQYHVQTFNMNAVAKGSSLRAEVVEPTHGYTANGVDIVVKDETGKIVQRYQSKYCKDPEATMSAFDKGDYRGQQKLVPVDQKGNISKKCTDRINCDGVTSTPLSKDAAKQMQSEVQSGKKDLVGWNDLDTAELSLGIANKAVQSTAIGIALGAGTEIASKIISGEEIDEAEVVAKALETGVDCGVKSAAAGALKVASEKGLISALPPGTPASTIANIAFVGIEDAKIVCKVAKGELSAEEGLDKIADTTISTSAGLVCSAQGMAVGSAIGSVFGPVGTFVGGLVGGGVGYLAGSTVGHCVYEGAKAVSKPAANFVQKTVSAVVNGVKHVGSAIMSGLKSLFGW